MEEAGSNRFVIGWIVVVQISLALLYLCASALGQTTARVLIDQEDSTQQCAYGLERLDLSSPYKRFLAINQIKQEIARNPNKAYLYIALGEIYLNSSFWHYGVEALRKALTIDPSQDKARNLLGKAFLDRGLDGWQARWFKCAIDELSKVTQASPFYPESCRLIAQSYLDLGMPDSAIASLRTLKRSSMQLDDWLTLGLCFWRLENFDSAETSFREALRLMEPNQIQRYLLPFFSKIKLDGNDTHQLFFVADQYWRKRDPNPATLVNERLVEHMARVAFADLHFTVDRLGKPGSTTARGEALIRYGLPKKWHFDPFGSGIIADETCIPSDYHHGLSKPNRDAIVEFSSSSGLDKPTWIWDYGAFTLRFTDTFLNSDYDFAYDNLDAEKYAIVTTHLPESYQLSFAKEIKVVLEALNILDQDGNPAIKINYAIDSVVTDTRSDSSLVGIKLAIQAAILDTCYNRIIHREAIETARPQQSPIEFPYSALISSLTVPHFGEASLVAISVESLANNAKGYSTVDFNPRNLTGDLSISDIEARFTPTGPPNPLHLFKHGGKAYFGFEIYNPTTDSEGVSEVQIDCSMEPKQKPSSIMGRMLRRFSGSANKTKKMASFSMSYVLRGKGPRIEHTLGLDLSKVDVGQHTFKIRATDRQTGRSVECETHVWVVAEWYR